MNKNYAVILISSLAAFFLACNEKPKPIYVPFELIKEIREQDTSAVRDFLENSENTVFVLKTVPEPFPLICETIKEGYTDISKILIDYGSDPNIVCDKGSYQNTPLHLASDSSLVNLLVSKGAKIETKNSFDETPLMSASRHGLNGAVKELLRMGADINATNSVSQSALELAMIYSGNEETYEILRNARKSRN